jgi:membrane fusion protein, copper/silver efflux system
LLPFFLPIDTQPHDSNMKRLISILLLACITITAGYWLGQRNNQNALPVIMTDSAKVTYVCPMHPNIVQDHPGNCPICGMDLVKTDQQDSNTQIHVDTATQQKFGVSLATAQITPLTQDIHTYASLTSDAEATKRYTPSFDSVLVKLYATRPGQIIAAGQPLYQIYSQDIQQLQNDYIDNNYRYDQALKSVNETRKQNRIMLESMNTKDEHGHAEIEKGMTQTEAQIIGVLQPMKRDNERLAARLKYAGFSDQMLRQLLKNNHAWDTLTVRAENTCTISEINVHPGMTLSAMTEILSCVETSHALLDIAFYPDQLDYIHEGENMDVEFDNGDHMQTKLAGLNTILDNGTRILKARIPITLPKVQHLGEYANVTLHSSLREVLTVPVSAVIRTGHGNHVMKFMGNGHFMVQQVITGMYNDELIGIIDGLKAGDKVAINGQFLLDSAASIAESADRYRQNK